MIELLEQGAKIHYSPNGELKLIHNGEILPCNLDEFLKLKQQNVIEVVKKQGKINIYSLKG